MICQLLLETKKTYARLSVSAEERKKRASDKTNIKKPGLWVQTLRLISWLQNCFRSNSDCLYLKWPALSPKKINDCPHRRRTGHKTSPGSCARRFVFFIIMSSLPPSTAESPFNLYYLIQERLKNSEKIVVKCRCSGVEERRSNTRYKLANTDDSDRVAVQK